MRDATNITTRAMHERTAWLRISANWSPNLPPAKNELDDSTRLMPIAISDSVMTRMRRSTFIWSRRWPGVSFAFAAVCVRAVSYTHLRAHETPEHLVCRLLL